MNKKALNPNDEYIVSLGLSERVKQGQHEITVTDKEITSDMMEVFNRINIIFTKYKKIKDMFKLPFEDYNRFKSYLNDDEIDIKEVDHYFYLNYFLIHLLSSGRLFVKFVENEFQDISSQSKDGNSHHLYKKKLSSIYDQSFSYRFCYHLRNYTQHKGSIVHSIKTSLIEEEKKAVSAKINIDILLSSGYKWKNAIRKELESKKTDETIDIENLINNYMADLGRIFNHSMQLFIKEYDAELKRLLLSCKDIYDVRKIPLYVCIKKSDLKKFEEKKEIFDPSKYSTSVLRGARNIDQIYIELSQLGIVELIHIE